MESNLETILTKEGTVKQKIKNIINYISETGDEDVHCRLLTWLNFSVIQNPKLNTELNQIKNGSDIESKYADIRGYYYNGPINDMFTNPTVSLYDYVNWNKQKTLYSQYSI